MECVLKQPKVAAIIQREHQAARLAREAFAAQMRTNQETPVYNRDFRTSEAHKTQYLSIGPRMGTYLYTIARTLNARNLVEFGTSFGISTLYLAAAAAENGGKVTGSEYHAHKAQKARDNLQDAGLSSYAEILSGDGRETLQSINAPIDLLFLDGSKDLYLDILMMLEKHLRPGAMIIADNADHLPEDEGFLQYVGKDNDRYLTTLVGFNKGLASQSMFLKSF